MIEAKKVICVLKPISKLILLSSIGCGLGSSYTLKAILVQFISHYPANNHHNNKIVIGSFDTLSKYECSNLIFLIMRYWFSARSKTKVSFNCILIKALTEWTAGLTNNSFDPVHLIFFLSNSDGSFMKNYSTGLLRQIYIWTEWNWDNLSLVQFGKNALGENCH